MNVSKTATIYKNIQQTICRTLEEADGTGKFSLDSWEKEIGSGLTCVMQNGSVIEKAGVNFSHVTGDFNENMAHLLGEKASKFEATGISSILHSGNPFVPTIHMNVRHFALDNGSSWFGGGIDLFQLILTFLPSKFLILQLTFYLLYLFLKLKYQDKFYLGLLKYPLLQKFLNKVGL